MGQGVSKADEKEFKDYYAKVDALRKQAHADGTYDPRYPLVIGEDDLPKSEGVKRVEARLSGSGFTSAIRDLTLAQTRLAEDLWSPDPPAWVAKRIAEVDSVRFGLKARKDPNGVAKRVEAKIQADGLPVVRERTYKAYEVQPTEDEKSTAHLYGISVADLRRSEHKDPLTGETLLTQQEGIGRLNKVFNKRQDDSPAGQAVAVLNKAVDFVGDKVVDMLPGKAGEVLTKVAEGTAADVRKGDKKHQEAVKRKRERTQKGEALDEAVAEGAAEDTTGLDGAGVLGEVLSHFKGAYPGAKTCADFLAKHGDATIVQAVAVRTPVKAVYKGLLDVVSQGDFSKTLAGKTYDDVFHLALWLRLSDGWEGTVEKNQRITITQRGLPEGERLDVPIRHKVTVAQMFDAARIALGDSRFFTYDVAKGQHCQQFIMALLKHSGLLSPTLKRFVLQDTEGLLKGAVGTAAGVLTDIAAHVQGGGGSAGTSAEELNEHLQDIKGYLGAVAADALPKRLKKGESVIVNMGAARTGGTHWCALCALPDGRVLFFDPFGGYAPPAVQRLAGTLGPIVSSTLQYQRERSDACGQFCAFVVRCVADGMPLYDILYSELDPTPSVRNERTVMKAWKK